MELNGIALEGASHSGADGVDDTGLRDDVVIHVEGIRRAGIGEERVLWMVVRLEEKLAVDGSNGELVDPVRLNPTDKTSHTDLLGSVDKHRGRYTNCAEYRFL